MPIYTSKHCDCLSLMIRKVSRLYIRFTFAPDKDPQFICWVLLYFTKSETEIKRRKIQDFLTRLLLADISTISGNVVLVASRTK